MRKFKEKTFKSPVLVSISCDKCKKEITKEGDIIDWNEVYSIEFCGGYGSVFGDGMAVECDLCQDCLKELIEPYMKVSEKW